MRAVLLALLIALALAPAALAQDATVAQEQELPAEAVEALRSDSVYVADDARELLPAAAADRVRERIEQSGEEIHVAVLADGDARTVSEQLEAEVGGGGTFVAIVDRRMYARPSSAAADAADAATDQGGTHETVLLNFVDELEGDEGIGTGGLILLGLAGAGGAAVLVSRRRRRREQAAEFAEVKDNARDDLVALGDDLRALDIDVELPGTRPEVKADYEVAVHAYDRADQAWRLARRPDDLEPVGSALEEGRWAMTSAKARLEGREPPERRSPCFFDPRHGPSTREVEWAPEHGEPRLVPACEADALRIEREEDPEARKVTIGGRRVPYWEAGPAYAPFAGGFFGVGVLPALMIGTIMGSAWDVDAGAASGGDAGGGDWGGGDFGGGDFGGGDFGGGGF
jgi:hypothetical protein